MGGAESEAARVVRTAHGGESASRLTRLAPEDEARYRWAVSRVAAAIERGLAPSVAANRVIDPGRLRLEPWRSGRARFLAGAGALAGRAGVVLVADVRRCYPSIGPGTVAAALLGMGCHPGEVARIGRLLARFRDQGVPGLPIGPEPSAVLANAVLAGADGALSAQGFPFLRWVDDVMVGAADTGGAMRARATLKAALGRVGLTLHPAKTRIVAPEAALSALRRSGSWPSGRKEGRIGCL